MRAAWAPCRTGGGLPAAPRDIVPEGGADAAALSSWVGRGTVNRTLLVGMQHGHDLTGCWQGELDAAAGLGSGRGSTLHRAAALERLAAPNLPCRRRRGSTLHRAAALERQGLLRATGSTANRRRQRPVAAKASDRAS